ncbi:hypothetical protein BD289DRAFT_164400 [Coniella lustricola]|uniref:Uncharacterized protein n=1 Tax=Coniella lustricola TaxID=2025994 RepID=A0A2T2ZUA0_9PEZI|nr:hypothetical protein BD289DRAFT_164400 [Coniella lustricola]
MSRSRPLKPLKACLDGVDSLHPVTTPWAPTRSQSNRSQCQVVPPGCHGWIPSWVFVTIAATFASHLSSCAAPLQSYVQQRCIALLPSRCAASRLLGSTRSLCRQSQRGQFGKKAFSFVLAVLPAYSLFRLLAPPSHATKSLPPPDPTSTTRRRPVPFSVFQHLEKCQPDPSHKSAPSSGCSRHARHARQALGSRPEPTAPAHPFSNPFAS